MVDTSNLTKRQREIFDYVKTYAREHVTTSDAMAHRFSRPATKTDSSIRPPS